MSTMRSFFSSVANFVPSLVFLLVFSFASTVEAGSIITAPDVNLSVSNALGILCNFINLLFTVLIILSVIFVIWAAWVYLQSGGDPGKLKEAGNRLLYAAIAVAVGIMARGVPVLMASLLGNTGSVQGAC